VWSIWSRARSFPGREVQDMFGVMLEGHPHRGGIPTREDHEGFPRREFAVGGEPLLFTCHDARFPGRCV
jgi:NADH-quinone oxidoreductase subunit C